METAVKKLLFTANLVKRLFAIKRSKEPISPIDEAKYQLELKCENKCGR